MSGELGRASYELDADLEPLRRGIKESKSDVKDFERTLDLLTGVSDIAAKQLSKIRMKADQLAETKGISDSFKRELADISADAERARADLERVKLGASNVAETTAAGDAIDRKLKDVTGNANEARRALESVRLAGIGAGGAGGGGIPGGGNRNPGAGVGPFGSGFGRIGLLGTAIGGGILTTPAAGPAVLGLLAATPVLAGAAAGSLGVLALAFDGVTKAIGGDKKAFDGLGPSAQEFVQTVRSLDGWFEKLKETAAGSLFPGLAKGLKDALSPGTLNAITSAVTLLGHALGQVGEMFGRYFGSSEFTSIFGPLMQSAARTVSNLSSAALHLFDALGVLARAGIPLTDWMTRGIAAASRLADSWLHAKDATGQLGGAMNEAKTSLELVGRLVGSLFNAVGALGSALYPVSKVAVKDLTDGLNALAGIIDQNKASIQAVVSGALSALVDMVKAASKAIAVAWPLAEKLTDKLGGWKTVFEALIGLKLASVIAGWAGAFTKLAGTAALGGAEAEAGGLLTKLTSLSEFGPISIPIMLLITDKHVTGSGSKYLNDILHGGSFTGTAKDAVGFLGSVLNSVGGRLLVPFGGYSVGMGGGTGGGGSSGGKNPPTPTQRGDMRGASAAGQLSGFRGMAAQAAARYGVPVDQFLAQINQESGFNPNATSPAGALGIAQFMPGTAKGYGIDPRNPAQALPAAAKMMSQLYAKYGSWALALAAYNAGSGTVDKYLAGKGSLPTETQNYVKSILGQSVSQATYNPAAGSTSPFGTDPAFTKNLGPKPPKPTGANLLPEALRNMLQKAKDNATSSQGSVAAHWLQVELDDLDKARKDLTADLAGASGKKKAAIQQELRNIDGQIASVNKQITANLHAQAQAIKTAFASKITSAAGGISAAMSTLKATLDAQFQAATQSYIDTVIGPKYFQGTDASGQQLQTPLEKQLADMQAADTLKQLQDAIDTATDPAAKQAAQRQLDEYNLSIRAVAERAQADHDYAEAVKTYQSQRDELERQLNLQLDTFGKGLADGTTKIGDLAGIVEGFGLSLTADDGVAGDFLTLQSATQTLAQVMMTEAARLAAVGDQKDAAAIQAKADTIGYGTTVTPGQSSVDSGLAGALGYFLLNPIHKMAAGGVGRVTMPTLFLAGEAGAEDFAFSGGGRSFAEHGGGGGETHIHIHGGTFIGGNKQQVARDLKPYLERVTTLTK